MGSAEPAGVVEAGEDIEAGQAGMSAEDIIDGIASTEVGEDGLHADTRATDHRSAITDFGIDFDMGHHRDKNVRADAGKSRERGRRF